MYSVFEKKFLTDIGKYCVCLHESDYDAQQFFTKLADHAKTSTRASIDTADLLSYITSIKLHDNRWKGTTHLFVLHWCDKVRLYQKLEVTTYNRSLYGQHQIDYVTENSCWYSRATSSQGTIIS